MFGSALTAASSVLGILTLSSEMHSQNTLPPMLIVPAPTVMFVRPSHPEKALNAMFTTLSGSTRLLRELQP